MRRKSDPYISSENLPQMKVDDYIDLIPWDKKVFGIDTYEIRHISEQILDQIKKIHGHFSVKVSPLFPKKILHDYGFYYCDSLIEPYCIRKWFIFHEHKKISISKNVTIESLTDFSRYRFTYDRFHRDFNLEKALADLRYENWLRELYKSGKCFGLLYNGEVAGFFAFDSNKIVLHALEEQYKGQGMAKYFWSVACRELFISGNSELTSSISSTNLPVLNLYISLGFKFRNPCDVYHLWNV